MNGFIVSGILLFSIALSSASHMKYPLHASCKLDWTFSTSCEEVQSQILAQIEQWDTEVCPVTAENCNKLPCGQKCLYKLISYDDSSITATHTTPVNRYVDNLNFMMTTSSSGCDVHAESEADKTLAWLDFGTNYCNLRNLIDGAGLSEDAGFTEDTSNAQCTQYDTADCSKY